MARNRARKTSTSRLDNAAIAAGSALGALAKRIDRLTSRRDAISAQLQRLVGQAESKLRGLASGKTPKRRAKPNASKKR